MEIRKLLFNRIYTSYDLVECEGPEFLPRRKPPYIDLLLRFNFFLSWWPPWITQDCGMATFWHETTKCCRQRWKYVPANDRPCNLSGMVRLSGREKQFLYCSLFCINQAVTACTFFAKTKGANLTCVCSMPGVWCLLARDAKIKRTYTQTRWIQGSDVTVKCFLAKAQMRVALLAWRPWTFTHVLYRMPYESWEVMVILFYFIYSVFRRRNSFYN